MKTVANRRISGLACNRRGEALSWIIGVWLGIAAGCAAKPAAAVVPIYDRFTSKLIELRADLNGDGVIDQWTYVDGNRRLRGEADTNGDGRIDRWEYFDAQGQLERVGSSSAGDGIEDQWSFEVPVGGLLRVGRSRLRDHFMDRVEFVDASGVPVRVEEDTNADGMTDKWERYEGRIMREAAFDTTLTAGRPNRRLLFDEAGRFVAVEGTEGGEWRKLGADAARGLQGGVRQ